MPFDVYPKNSPQAIARILAMVIVTDNKLDPRELEMPEKLHFYEAIGINREEFVRVFYDYCEDLFDSADDKGIVHLVDVERINHFLEEIDDRRKQVLTCAMALDLAKADEEFSDVEIALVRHMMGHWSVSLEDLESEFSPA